MPGSPQKAGLPRSIGREPGRRSETWYRLDEPAGPTIGFPRQANDKPEQGKQLKVHSPLGKAPGRTSSAVVGEFGSKDAPAFKVVGLYLEPANDSGDSNLDDASGNCRCQEFTCEGLFLGLRQSFKCLANPLG